jgi:hypothetical protein
MGNEEAAGTRAYEKNHSYLGLDELGDKVEA